MFVCLLVCLFAPGSDLLSPSRGIRMGMRNPPSTEVLMTTSSVVVTNTRWPSTWLERGGEGGGGLQGGLQGEGDVTGIGVGG